VQPLKTGGNPVYRYPERMGFNFFSAGHSPRLQKLGRTRRQAAESAASLLKASTLYDLHQYHHDCDDQENVDESTHGVGRDQAKQPKDNQDNRNSSEHFRTSPVNAESSHVSDLNPSLWPGRRINQPCPSRQAD
jgi:hypothetical protein